eukprot:scaffold2045_cov404-Prasinococcus_capsulatus_cf.AAC.65
MQPFKHTVPTSTSGNKHQALQPKMGALGVAPPPSTILRHSREYATLPVRTRAQTARRVVHVCCRGIGSPSASPRASHDRRSIRTHAISSPPPNPGSRALDAEAQPELIVVVEDPRQKARTALIWKTLGATILTGMLFLMWYAGNIGFNIYNKQLLRVLHYPVTVSAFFMGMGAVLGGLTWLSGAVKKPRVGHHHDTTRDDVAVLIGNRVYVGSLLHQMTPKLLLACQPLAFFHAFTNTLMLTSLAKVAVSLTHTIRAMEPLFVTAASALIFKTNPSPQLLASLIPIVAGVAIASATDVSFSMVGPGKGTLIVDGGRGQRGTAQDRSQPYLVR